MEHPLVKYEIEKSFFFFFSFTPNERLTLWAKISADDILKYFSFIIIVTITIIIIWFFFIFFFFSENGIWYFMQMSPAGKK